MYFRNLTSSADVLNILGCADVLQVSHNYLPALGGCYRTGLRCPCRQVKPADATQQGALHMSVGIVAHPGHSLEGRHFWGQEKERSRRLGVRSACTARSGLVFPCETRILVKPLLTSDRMRLGEVRSLGFWARTVRGRGVGKVRYAVRTPPPAHTLSAYCMPTYKSQTCIIGLLCADGATYMTYI